MAKYTYKNTSNVDLVVIGVGEVASGATITSEVELNNPNLKLVDNVEVKADKREDKK